MQTQIRNTRPRVKIITGPLAGMDISHLIVTAHTEKDVGQPAGIFNITLGHTGLNPTKTTYAGQLSSIYQNLTTNHLISIGFTSDCCMLGMVDHINHTHVTDGSGTSHSLSVSGRDLGKALQTDTAYTLLAQVEGLEEHFPDGHGIFNTYRAFGKPLEYVTYDGQKQERFVNENPISAIEWIVSVMPGMQILQDGVGPVLTDYLILDTHTDGSPNTYDGDVLFQQDLTSFTGDLWSFINSCIDEFYEVFIDSAIDPVTGNPAAYLRVRPKPFDRLGDMVAGKEIGDSYGGKFAWENSPTFMQRIGYRNSDTAGPEPLHQVQMRDGDFTASFGVNDYEVFSVFDVDDKTSFQAAVMEKAGFSELRAKWIVLIDPFLVKRFGFKVKTTSSQLINKDDFENQTTIKRDRAYNWHRFNAILESGTLELPGNDNRRIGDRLMITDKVSKAGNVGMEFYIRSVENHWDVENQIVPRQTLGLIRGHNVDDLKAFEELLIPLRGDSGLGS